MGLPGVDVFERAGLKAWPGTEVEWDGHWVRRAANGYTQRANSVQCFDPADESDVEARIAAATEWFVERGIRPTFRVTPQAGPAILAALDAAAWRQVDDSHLFAMELGSMEPDPRGQLYDLLDPTFLSVQKYLRGYSDEKLGKLRAVLEAVDGPGRGIVLYSPEGAPVASALMAIGDGVVITGNVITDTRQRRKGYGAAMMRTGLAWAKSAGATLAALNVAADNAAGQALYTSLGYRRQYDYTYRTPVAA
jgi:ribosomal protein S18 acetylase RimI-like enzyme